MPCDKCEPFRECYDCKLKRWQREYDEHHQIKCPACDYVYADCEEMSPHVTYHGEDGPQKSNCPNCDKVLMVTEKVDRTWEVALGGTP